MRGRACLITVLVLASTSLPARGQSVVSARTATKTWTAPRTADGRPDLQGVWLIHTATPLERPAALAGRSTLTDEEVAEFRRRAARLFGSGNSDFAVGDGVFQAVLANPATYTNPNSTHGATDMVDLEFDNRTSLIVEPQDGRVPTLTPEGRNRQAATNAAFRRPSAPADVGNALRCISWGVPRLGGRYGSGDMAYYQIIQSPGHVVLFVEAGHEARVIPIDNSPHLSSTIRQWNGDSRGRWEGDTLVVDTTNFSPDSYFMGSTAGLHLVERFTRTAEDTITYEMTISDPSTWVKPWTAMMPMRARQEALYEFACHEGNYHIMAGMLVGAQVQEAEAAAERGR
ncbi:MAG TPA: hypothetical protein VMS40_26435 [Vicinamibacterales bacterium]|nr:hypothetical protein [Vicinamibacterales bacterium]